MATPSGIRLWARHEQLPSIHETGPRHRPVPQRHRKAPSCRRGQAPVAKCVSASPAGDEAELVAPLRPGKHSTVRVRCEVQAVEGVAAGSAATLCGRAIKRSECMAFEPAAGSPQQAAKVLGAQVPRRSGARFRLLLLGYTLPPTSLSILFMQVTDKLSLCCRSVVSQVTAHAAYAHRSGNVIASSCYLPFEQGCANQHN